jgi:spore germination cell wall hydrolase CwlJ-like protein
LPPNQNNRWSDDEGIFVKALGRIGTALAVMVLPLLVSACSQTADLGATVKSMVAPVGSHGYSAREKECLMRAMFFESNRSSRDGLVAVGTVVMNRVRSGKYGNTICEVVGAPRQFAPGVMTRPMNSKALPDVEAAADAVLKGERHSKVKNSMYFHTAGLKFPYKNMHYTVVAGGNAFYERRGRRGEPVVLPPERLPGQPAVMIASAEPVATPATAQPAVTVAQAASIQPDVATAQADASPAFPVVVAVANPAPVAKARRMMSTRGDGGSISVARSPRLSTQPAASEQPVQVAMAMDGPSPSAQTTEAVPFANAATSMQPELPAVTNAIPTSETEVAATAAADGWSTGDPGIAATKAPVIAASFDVEQSDADAIGAMIVSEERPMMGFN